MSEGIPILYNLKSIEEAFSHEIESKVLNKKRGNSILRQELKDLTPNLNSKFGIILMIFMCLTFSILAFIVLKATNNTFSLYIDYSDCKLNTTCIKEFTLNTTIKTPIYIHYYLNNFYSNHKEYSNSKMYSQLKGEEDFTENPNKYCQDSFYNYEIFNNNNTNYLSITGKTLNPNDVAIPCGKIAKSLFNDTYNLILKNSNKNIHINTNNISDKFQRENIFKNIESKLQSQWTNTTNGIIFL